MKFLDPLQNTGAGEFKIKKKTTYLLDLIDIFFSAPWASFAFDVNDTVGASFRSFKFSMSLIDYS